MNEFYMFWENLKRRWIPRNFRIIGRNYRWEFSSTHNGRQQTKSRQPSLRLIDTKLNHHSFQFVLVVDGSVLLLCQSFRRLGTSRSEPGILGRETWCLRRGFPDDNCWPRTKVYVIYIIVYIYIYIL